MVVGVVEGVGGLLQLALTARQSMVNVDVAQVFWRPFWQTHFVVIVDHPPGGEEQHLRRVQIMKCQMVVFHFKSSKKVVAIRFFFIPFLG